MEEEKKKERKVSAKDVIDGRFLTEKFVSKQLKLLILIVVLIIIFISNSYSCMKKLAEIEQLKTELEAVKYENLSLSTTLISVSRYSQVKELLEQKGINLSNPGSPAFEIKK